VALMMDRQKIIQTMKKMVWYHKIELAPGIVTPGNDWEAMWAPMRAFLEAADLRGKRVLEVGCWDGYWSFEAERLGAAEVWATDDVSQRRNLGDTVRFAIECRGSKVKYRDDVSAYDADKRFDEKFDVVICYGVLYHLRYPVFGLAALRNALKTGGVLLLESAVLFDTPEPIMRWGYESIHPTDPSTWNAPSIPCLKLLLETSYMDVEACEVYSRHDAERRVGRGLARARAVVRSDDDVHVVPDHFLRQHNPGLRER
jgi:tRNA (mo5U34)-methyltransferase